MLGAGEENDDQDMHIPGLDDEPVTMTHFAQGGQGQQRRVAGRNSAKKGSQTVRGKITQRSSNLSLNDSMSDHHGGTSQRVGSSYDDSRVKGHSVPDIKRNMDGTVMSEPSLQRNLEESKESEDGKDLEHVVDTAVSDDSEAHEGNTSVAQTYFNMLKCFVGIGILATPAAL